VNGAGPLKRANVESKIHTTKVPDPGLGFLKRRGVAGEDERKPSNDTSGQ